MARHFKNVTESVKQLTTAKKFKKDALKALDNKGIAKFLFTLRCEQNLTQMQLAKKMGCTQSKISKIENSFDSELAINNLFDYGKALNLQLEIGFRNTDVKIVDLIKYHAFKIEDCLEHLVDLVKDDKDMARGVLQFHLEAFVNVRHLILKNIPILHKKSLKKSKQSVHLSSPLTDKLQEKEMLNDKPVLCKN